MTRYEFNPTADRIKRERSETMKRWTTGLVYSAVELGLTIIFATMILSGMRAMIEDRLETFFEFYVVATLIFILVFFIYQIFRRTTFPGQFALAPISFGIIIDNIGFFTIAVIMFAGFSIFDLYCRLRIAGRIS